LALRSGGVSFRKCCPRHTTMENIRIIVVDNQELVAVGIAARLANTPQIHVVGHAKSGKALLDGLRSTQPDLVIIDVSLHEMDGIDTTRQLRRLSPGLKVLAHSALSQIEYVNSMLIEGACGYVVKEGPREELAEAIRTVMAGGTYISPAARDSIAKGYRYTEKRVDGDYIGLTAREREVIRLIALERTNSEISAALRISEDTVKTHRKNLMSKLNVRGVAGLVKYAVDRCWV
ncbi:MAG: response regulator transcription factor, partial [Flavobacteriales bacterium]